MLDLPTKRTQENFASHIETRNEKHEVHLTIFTLILGLFYYWIYRLRFRFSSRKIKKFYWRFFLFSLIILMLGIGFKNQPKQTLVKDTTITSKRVILTKGIINHSEIKPIITPIPSEIKQVSKTSFTGHISHYSRAGCLGCSKNFTMANGETLDDNAFTIAVPPGWLPMNSIVIVKNLSNGKEVEARVTDTGGFLKYGRIADLTLAVGRALETKTDVSEVEVVLK